MEQTPDPARDIRGNEAIRKTTFLGAIKAVRLRIGIFIMRVRGIGAER